MQNIDKSNMRKVLLDFPKQLETSLSLSQNIKVEGIFDNIIICGLGGSALPADVLSYWANESGIKTPPIYIHRDYGLPKQAGENSLIICLSYSGNTEEVLASLNESLKRNLKIAAITSGGKIGEICQKNNLPWIKVPMGLQPRMALGYQFTSLLKILSNSGIIPDASEEILSTAGSLKKISFEKEGKRLSKKLINKIPIIYTSNSLKCAAQIWKIKFNENSKVPAFCNYFPELNHNEMVGFTNVPTGARFHIIILKDLNENPRNLERISLFVKLMKKRKIEMDSINIKKGGPLFKIFSTLLLGDWVSYYLALAYKTDPTPVQIVEEFKKELGK